MRLLWRSTDSPFFFWFKNAGHDAASVFCDCRCLYSPPGSLSRPYRRILRHYLHSRPAARQFASQSRVYALPWLGSYIIRARNYQRQNEGQAIPYCGRRQRQCGPDHVQRCIPAAGGNDLRQEIRSRFRRQRRQSSDCRASLRSERGYGGKSGERSIRPRHDQKL